MEFCGSLAGPCNLEEAIQTSKLTQSLAEQLVESVQNIHSKGIVHRDLKAKNIFIKDEKVKIGNFGLASEIEKDFNNLKQTDELALQQIISRMQNLTG